MAEYYVFKGGFSVEEIVWIIGVFAALWGIMDVLRRITLAITVEKHIKHRLFLIMDDSDDPWFTVRGIKERAGLCGLLKKDCVAVIWNGSGGKKMEFTVLRGDETLTIYVTPVMSESAGEYRIGLWLKDGTAGIGTVTYIIPETGAFGGLGHGICDMSTGKLCDMSRGIVSDVTVSGINRGVSGAPGELKGIFSNEKSGTVTKNTERGVFGVFSDPDKYAALTKPIETAGMDSLEEGDAVIYCTVDGTGINEYSVKISRGTSKDPAGSFNVEITDKTLIEKTGGIVQGMSGSPVVQNGKLIGAITHVLISDPTRGYGIYIRDMLNEMPDVMK